jgi:hypothetical protein
VEAGCDPPAHDSAADLEDLVGSPQLAILPLQLDQAATLLSGQPRPLTVVDLSLLDPVSDRLGSHPEVAGRPE